MKQNYQKEIESRLIIPAIQFMQRERSSGIILGLSVIVALILANSPLREQYNCILDMHFGLVFNGDTFFNYSLAHWINDGLMSMFFFVVGLELKHEFIGGELKDIRNVTLPVVAAVFGMIFPALIYAVFNAGTPVAGGWGIPMATDIAFALAVLYVLGDRVPVSVKVFLTTLAIVDDLGSVVVIALFYTSHISLANLGIGVLFLFLMYAGNRLGVKNVWFYGLLGIGGVWTAFLLSGIHATIAAVLSALMIPADSRIPEAAFIARAKKSLRLFEMTEGNDVRTLEPEQVEILARVQSDSRKAMPPLQRLEHSLQPLVSYLIMPIFALGNAGVSFVDMDPSILLANNVALGVFFGLLAGKPLGILSAVWLTEKIGLGKRLEQMTWRRLTGLGFLASIGFTMSMFVTVLAFQQPEFHVQAKVAIFLASLFGGFLGYRVLKK